MPLKHRSTHIGTVPPKATATYRKKVSPQKLLSIAPDILRELEDGSPFFQNNERRHLPRFNLTELGIGATLGEGAFCRVNEINCISLKHSSRRTRPRQEAAVSVVGVTSLPAPREDRSAVAGDIVATDGDHANAGTFEEGKACAEKSTTATYTAWDSFLDTNDSIVSDSDGELDGSLFDEEEARQFMMDNCLRPNPQGEKFCRYAIKTLLPNLSEFDRAKGIIDLAIEAKFLSVISHPNIVKMRGTATGASLGPNFFLVLDRLFCTLDDKIDMWKEDNSRFSGLCCGLYGGNKKELSRLSMEKLLCAYDLSCAMRYLHKHNIVYRDIKPENIGFDVRSDIKLFDFGLAKELRAEDKTKDGLYNITGRTGSLLYMAPEVAVCKPYNLKVDSYSFGILLWEMWSMEQPFRFFTSREIYDRVAVGGYRPTLHQPWPFPIRKVIKECWSVYSTKRPTFKSIAATLRKEFVDMAAHRAEHGEDQSVNLSLRSRQKDRSSHSMHGKYSETEW